jgi:L-alanine-DL-glutamate epimerase-like enolase superfamily enzyme
MKITNVRAISLGYSHEATLIPRGFSLVRVETDAGHIGYGEASTSFGHMYPWLVESIVDNILARVLIGSDPLEIKARVHDMSRYLSPYIGSDGITSQVIGAVEIALWDILGKETGKSISALFGSMRSEVPLYGTGTVYTADDKSAHAKFFEKALQHEFAGIKTRIGNGLERDIKQIEEARALAGPDMKLMVDAYWSYSLQSAIWISKAMEEFDIYFFEEPMPQSWVAGYQRLCAESPVPIAVGERIYSVNGFELVIRNEAGDVLQPDAAVCGGILECTEVATLGKVSNRIVIPHIGGLSAVGIAANLHLAAIINCPIMEYDAGPFTPLRDEILRDPIFSMDRIKGGCLTIPEGPGLGIDIDESVFERYAFKPGKVYPDIMPQFGIGQI